MAAIGSVWKAGSWVSVGGWAANTWAAAVINAFLFYLVRHHRRAGYVVRRGAR